MMPSSYVACSLDMRHPKHTPSPIQSKEASSSLLACVLHSRPNFFLYQRSLLFLEGITTIKQRHSLAALRRQTPLRSLKLQNHIVSKSVPPYHTICSKHSLEQTQPEEHKKKIILTNPILVLLTL